MRGNLHSDSRLDLFEFIFGFSRISYLFATTYDMYIYIYVPGTQMGPLVLIGVWALFGRFFSPNITYSSVNKQLFGWRCMFEVGKQSTSPTASTDAS